MRAPKTVRVQSIPSLAGGNSSKEGPSGQPARNGTEGRRRRRRRKRGRRLHWLCASKGSSPACSPGHLLLIHIPSSSPASTASAISAEPEIRSICSTKQGLPVWLRGDVCRTGTVVQTATTAESGATNID